MLILTLKWKENFIFVCYSSVNQNHKTILFVFFEMHFFQFNKLVEIAVFISQNFA